MVPQCVGNLGGVSHPGLGAGTLLLHVFALIQAAADRLGMSREICYTDRDTRTLPFGKRRV